MKTRAGILFSVLALGAFNLNAADTNFGVGVKAGTMGYGADFTVTVTKTINARLSLTSFEFDDKNETFIVGDASDNGTIDVILEADIGANALLLDWHVFDGTFHLTAGLVKNNGNVIFTGTLRDDFVINGQAVSTSDITGAMNGKVTLGESYEPYIGIGWGRKASAEGGLSVSFEMGVALLDPKVDFNATVNTGGANGLSQAELDSRLQSAENDANDDISDFETYPVISLGINYAF